MQLIKTDGGFIFESEKVRLNFLTDALPSENGGIYDILIKGDIPAPIIEPSDRLLLPVDEGIAISANREYVSGELDFENIKGHFCGRDGTLSMVIVEREGKFLLIVLHDGANAMFSARRV